MQAILNDAQIIRAVEIVQDFMEREGLELWITRIRGDEFKPVRWVSPDILKQVIKEK